jgi:hypothetical protein
LGEGFFVVDLWCETEDVRGNGDVLDPLVEGVGGNGVCGEDTSAELADLCINLMALGQKVGFKWFSSRQRMLGV